MTARRLFSVLSVGLGVGLIASAGVVAAQPATSPTPSPPTTPKTTTPPTKQSKAKGAKGKKTPLAPAKDPGAGSGSSAADAAATAPAAPAADAPSPKDLNGTDENPDAPKSVNDPDAPPPPPPIAPVATTRSGYPIEEALRPIVLPQNLSEVSINPHAQVSPYAGATALRARYGVTSKVQLGLTYLIGGIYDDPATAESSQGFHPGKAVGIDVTYLIQDWIGVQVGVPLYISPLAVSLTIGAPIKFTFGDKFALGGLDDFLNIKLDNFAPTFYQELQNATNANEGTTNTIKSAGELRVSLYGIYQYQPDIAITARTGIQMEDFATGKTDGCLGECLTTFLRAGFDYTPRKYLDLGLSIGFDDLAHGGSFAPAGYLAFRI
ncbi:MAG TPA: hypothetical protein VH165_22135 [Kofleriaceae bacterium]|jgi:hypothetical protein|nr:hypothetical protein [Kofleriaceae bacterium]